MKSNTLNYIQLVIVLVMLGLVIIGVSLAFKVSEQEEKHYSEMEIALTEIHSIIEGRSACVIPKETIEEVIEP